jgi:hypothetical protein
MTMSWRCVIMGYVARFGEWIGGGLEVGRKTLISILITIHRRLVATISLVIHHHSTANTLQHITPVNQRWLVVKHGQWSSRGVQLGSDPTKDHHTSAKGSLGSSDVETEESLTS